jgi:hypothetical protein
MSDNSDTLNEIHADEPYDDAVQRRLDDMTDAQWQEELKRSAQERKRMEFERLHRQRDLTAYRAMGMLDSLMLNGLLPFYLVANAKDILNERDRLNRAIDEIYK